MAIYTENLVTFSNKEVYQELIKEIADTIGDCVVVDNVIYEIVTDMRVSDGKGDWIELEKGIFSVYEFRGNKVYNYETKHETAEKIEEIGVKPLSYFVMPNPTIHDSVKEFLEWHDYFFGRNLFDFENESDSFIELFNAIEPYLFESMREELIPEKNLLIETDGGFIVSDELKELIINTDSSNQYMYMLFQNSFSELFSYTEEQLIKMSKFKWEIKPGKMTPREDYRDYADNYGIYYDFTLYVDGNPFDYVSSAFIQELTEETLTEEEKKDGNESLVATSKDEFWKHLEETEQNPYEVLGEELFTEYAEYLPTDINSILEIINFNISDKPESVKKFIKEKMKNEFNEITADTGGVLTYTLDERDIKNIRSRYDVSEQFFEGLFSGNLEEFFEFGSYGGSSIEDYSYLLPNSINEENLKELEKIGITKDFITKCLKTDEEDEDILCETLKSVLLYSIYFGLKRGSEQQALDYFEKAVEDALPFGVKENKEKYDNRSKHIEISKDFFENNVNLEIVSSVFETESDELKDNIIYSFLEYFNDTFNFSEPRYGFDGFSKEDFNHYLFENGLPDLKDIVKNNRGE